MIHDDPDTSNLGLWFSAGEEPLEDFCAAMVYVRGCTADKKGTRFLTPASVTEKEFEYEVSRLKAELDQVLDQARKKFRKGEAKAKARRKRQPSEQV